MQRLLSTLSHPMICKVLGLISAGFRNLHKPANEIKLASLELRVLPDLVPLCVAVPYLKAGLYPFAPSIHLNSVSLIKMWCFNERSALAFKTLGIS